MRAMRVARIVPSSSVGTRRLRARMSLVVGQELPQQIAGRVHCSPKTAILGLKISETPLQNSNFSLFGEKLSLFGEEVLICQHECTIAISRSLRSDLIHSRPTFWPGFFYTADGGG